MQLAVVLAAGRGSRFVGSHHKLLAHLDATGTDTTTVVEVAVGHARQASIGPVLVIAGAVSLPASLATLPDVTVVHHPRWAEGQATSLAAAVDVARTLGAESIVVGLGDQPGISVVAWRRVAAAQSPIAIATYDGAPRNPVKLDRSVWDLLPTTGDEGARILTRLKPDLVQQVPCDGSPDDIDTVEDLAQWQSRSSTSSPSTARSTRRGR